MEEMQISSQIFHSLLREKQRVFKNYKNGYRQPDNTLCMRAIKRHVIRYFKI